MISGMFFERGQIIRRREVLHGRLWLEHPVRVVSDSPEALAVLLEPGSTFTFPDHPTPHPWRANTCWTGTTVLQVHRPGDAYAAWKFFDLHGVFTHWYINFEAPIVKDVDASGGGSYDTDDHGIDIVIPAGGTWSWKDYDDPQLMEGEGRIASGQAEAIMKCAVEVASDIDAGRCWWSAWEDWTPSTQPSGQLSCGGEHGGGMEPPGLTGQALDGPRDADGCDQPAVGRQDGRRH